MKKIILLRHAKSGQKKSKIKDIDRGLAEKGINDIPLMAKVLISYNIIPDLIMASSATRTIETAKLIAKEMHIGESSIITEEDLYLSSGSRLFKEITYTDDKIDTLMIVSHNPGLLNLADILSDVFIDNLPTCGAVAFEFKIDSWVDLKKGKGRFLYFEYPKKNRVINKEAAPKTDKIKKEKNKGIVKEEQKPEVKNEIETQEPVL